MNIVGIKVVADFLKVKESTLYSWAEKGSIPSYKINGLLRFDMDEIREWIKESRKTPIRSNMTAKKTSPNQDIDSIVKKAIDAVKGKGYNPSIGKPGPNQALRKEA